MGCEELCRSWRVLSIEAEVGPKATDPVSSPVVFALSAKKRGAGGKELGQRG